MVSKNRSETRGASPSAYMMLSQVSQDGVHNRNGHGTDVWPTLATAETETKDKKVEGSVGLKRELGLFSAVNLIVGVMIGSGIFVSPTSALQRSGSVALCLIVWGVCGGISLLGALAFAELGTVVPKSGAEYAYFQESFGHLHRFWGPLPSFICSWIYVIVLRPAEVAVITLTFAEYVCQPFFYCHQSLDPSMEFLLKRMIAILVLGLITSINIMSVKLYVKVQNAFTLCKLLVCFVVIIGGIIELCRGNTSNLATGFKGTSFDLRDIALAIYSGLWAYDGWSTVTVVTEEIKQPEVNILRSILIGVPLVSLVYVMMNMAYMAVLTVPEMVQAPAVAVLFGDKIFGAVSFIIPLGVAFSTFGCALGIQFSVTRLCFVAAREGHMIEVFSYVHVRRLTPAPAVILQGFLTLILILSGNIAMLIDFASFLIWIFYGMAMVSLIIMRRTKKDVERPYKVPIVIPIFIMMVAVFLTLVPIVTDPTIEYLFAIAFIVAGILVYIPLVYYEKKPKWMDKFTYFMQVLMEVVPPENGTD